MKRKAHLETMLWNHSQRPGEEVRLVREVPGPCVETTLVPGWPGPSNVCPQRASEKSSDDVHFLQGDVLDVS